MFRKTRSTALLLVVLIIALSFFSLPAYAALGDFLDTWGSYGSGDGQFEYPYGIAVDTTGNVYVTDYDLDKAESRMQVFSNTGTFLRAWGTNDVAVSGIAVDSNGDVYVGGFLRGIQVFSNTGTLLRQWGLKVSDNEWSLFPYGIAVDSKGNVYVTQLVSLYNSFNYKIQVYSNIGTFLREWGSSGSGDGQFSWPIGIAVDSDDNVYVADALNNRIQVFSNAGTFLRTWGTSGRGYGQFQFPWGIALDSIGNVYVTDSGNNRIQAFSKQGAFLGAWGTHGTGDGQFNFPTGIAVDSNEHVFVCDTDPIDYVFNSRIEVFKSYSQSNTDITPPTVTISASPNVLWPPNNKMVDVKIDGSATDDQSGIASVVITVTDEYGVYNMTVLGFGSTIRLEALRKGTDKDGRVYTITAVATDNAGNQATATTTVIVPHDQR